MTAWPPMSSWATPCMSGRQHYLRPLKNVAVSAAVSFQVAGSAGDVPGSLNLRDFERLQARLRFEYSF